MAACREGGSFCTKEDGGAGAKGSESDEEDSLGLQKTSYPVYNCFVSPSPPPRYAGPFWTRLCTRAHKRWWRRRHSVVWLCTAQQHRLGRSVGNARICKARSPSERYGCALSLSGPFEAATGQPAPRSGPHAQYEKASECPELLRKSLCDLHRREDRSRRGPTTLAVRCRSSTPWTI